METWASSADETHGMSGASELTDLFRRVPVALYRTDEQGNLLVANDALVRLLGYDSLGDLLSATSSVTSVYVNPAERKRWIEEMNEKGLVFDFDVELRRADGSTIWVQDTARAIRDDQGRLLYYEGALIDVTEKVAANKARQEFLATVSHELRNPIAVVVGLSHELADRYEAFGDKERHDMSEMIARQADDAAWLIEDLLIAYRDDVSAVAISPHPFDVVEAVNPVLTVAPDKIDLTIEGNHTEVFADPRRTRQIVRNLINNAVNHGGDDIAIRVDSTEKSVHIRVCDNGTQIPEPELEEIFQAFKRGTRSNHPSSVGLGLPVARKLARLMGGEITYSHQGGYSIFTLSLPRAPV